MIRELEEPDAVFDEDGMRDEDAARDYTLGLMALLRIVQERIRECRSKELTEAHDEQLPVDCDFERVLSENPLVAIDRELAAAFRWAQCAERRLHEIDDCGVYRLHGNADDGWTVQQCYVVMTTSTRVEIADRNGESDVVFLPRERIQSAEVVSIGEARYAWGRVVRRLLEEELAVGWDRLEEARRRWDTAVLRSERQRRPILEKCMDSKVRQADPWVLRSSCVSGDLNIRKNV